MRYKKFCVRETRKGHVHKMDFDYRHFSMMGILATPEYGMPASEAMHWVNEMNRQNEGKQFVYWLEEPEL